MMNANGDTRGIPLLVRLAGRGSRLKQSIVATVFLLFFIVTSPVFAPSAVGHAAGGNDGAPALMDAAATSDVGSGINSAALVTDLQTSSSIDGTHGGRFVPQYQSGLVARFASADDVQRGQAPMPDNALATGATGTGGGLLGWAYDSFVDGASIILGYGVRRSNFTFTRKSDNASGTIVDRDYPAYFLIYSTKPSFFENSRFGYTFMIKLSSFDMNQQIATGTVIGGSPVDVHTDLQGIIGYAVPSLYYQWGEHRSTGTFFLIGAGLGLATTTYSGTIELRSPTTTEVANVRDQSFSLHPAWTTFLEARWLHWGGYLSIMRAQLPGESYDTQFEDVSFYLGYRLFF
jgi:hypothetical protein